jgi:hypothetical protein
VSAARLQRFFSRQDGCFRIQKPIREMLVFAPQNLLEDPPFTKLDFVSCRNLLIYVEAELQQHAKQVIRLIGSDVGRPIGDLVSRLRYDALIDDCQNVLRNLASKEIEVQSNVGAWYLLRIGPYRTAENVIDGLVLTFDDITQVKHLQRETERVLGALTHSPTAVFGQDQELRYQWTSSRLFDREPDETVGRSDAELLPQPASDAITGIKRRVLESGQPVRQRVSLSLANGKRTYDLFVQPARDAAGSVLGVTGVITEIQKEIEDGLRPVARRFACAGRTAACRRHPELAAC